MKRFVFERLSLFHFFLILSLFFSTSTWAHPGHDHHDFTPFCGDLDLESCLQEKIDKAEIVFEGTVLESKKYQDDDGSWYIESVYQIHKVFKGDLIEGRVTTTVSLDELRNYYVSHFPSLQREEIFFYPPKEGVTGIILAHQSRIRKKSVLKKYENSVLLAKDLVPFSLTYEFGYDNNYPMDQKDFILFERHREKTMSFKLASNVYQYVEKATGLKVKDFTKRQFRKMTRSEWHAHLLKKNPEHREELDQWLKNEKAMTPFIQGFSNDIPGGNGSVLTIEGSDFGFVIGKVLFEPVAMFDMDMALTLDEFDMSFSGGLNSWTTEEVQVVLPGEVHDKTSEFMGIESYLNVNGPISSGMKIQKSTGEVPMFWSATLNIPFSLSQEIENPSPNSSEVTDKRRARITSGSNEDYIEYYVHQDVYDNCEAMAQINEAMKTWKCATGIDWRIIEINDIADAPNGSSTISFDDGQDGISLSYGAICISSYDYNENDIRLREMQTSGDWFGTMLHELGHSHGLNHTAPGPGEGMDLMQPSGLGPGTIQPDDLAGALDVRQNSMSSSCNDAIDFEEFGDYFMRDLEADVGNEPNCEAGPANDPDVYGSPDVWNCVDFSSTGCGGVNQQPLEGAINWMQARVTNRSESCQASEGVVHFYWTIGSTGEDWSEDWINDVQGDCLIGDFVGTSAIGILDPGESRIVFKSWEAPIINELIGCDVYRYPWDVNNETYQVCLLARIVSEKDYMFLEQEGVDIAVNARNSNNIATKNTKLLDDPDLFVTPKPHHKGKYIGDVSWVIFHNNNDTPQPLDLTFTSVGEQSFDFQYVELLLSNELFSQVVESPFMEAQVTEPNVIRVAGDGKAVLPYIKMAAEEKQLIGIRLSVEAGKMKEYENSTKGAAFYVQHRASTPEQNIRLSSRCTFFVPESRGGHSEQWAQEGRLESLVDNNNEPPTEILIYNVAGQFIRKMNILDNPYDQEFQEQLNAGVYLYVYRNEIGIVKTEKVVVIR